MAARENKRFLPGIWFCGRRTGNGQNGDGRRGVAALNIATGAVVTIGPVPPEAFAPFEAFGAEAGLAASPVQPVPEPGSALLIASGLVTLFGLRRRRS
jgi:PEP-CTERM motif